MGSKSMPNFLIDFEPIGRRISVSTDVHLLTAAQEAGVSIAAVCGGVGVCHDCKIRIISGAVSSITNSEKEAFSAKELEQGWRLACQVHPLGDLKIEIPPDSMTTSQRLQIEGQSRNVSLDPMVIARDFSLSPPTLDDLRADWERFREAFNHEVSLNLSVDLPVLTQFSDEMRKNDWEGRALIDAEKGVVGFLPRGQDYFGLAVDIGTTKIAAFLINLVSGETIYKTAAMNPQIAYGEDVVSRISYANQGAAQRQSLQQRLVETINELSLEACKAVGAEIVQVADFVVVGNTAVHHLFTGLSVHQLGTAPYVPAVRRALRFPAYEVGLLSAPGAQVYLPPNIAGYVGADHIAMVLASGIAESDDISLALDIGTNTEISLSRGGRLVSCSCASGPAFEGAHIHAGMRAVPGAIERVEFIDGEWYISTVDDRPAVGICGSGILDVVASLFQSGQIDSTGRFTEFAYSRVPYKEGGAIVLVPARDSGTGRDILVTRSDIREIQLAKAAIRGGVEALLASTQTRVDEIDRFIVAGAFGTYLHVDSAVRIGMFPRLPKERYYQIGNAAGAGAQQMLVSRTSRHAAEQILANVKYIELTTDPGFMAFYVEAMGFENQHKEN